jgi:acyl-CoA dehydrogenase
MPLDTVNDDGQMDNLAASEYVRPLLREVEVFLAEKVLPMEEMFLALDGQRNADSFAPGQMDLLERVKDSARSAGLWNLLLPRSEGGRALSNLDYAHIALALAKSRFGADCLNCLPADTRNMEVLLRFGTPDQQRKWLDPLMAGDIRSAFAVTEPESASSDPSNLTCRATLDDDWVIDGEKYFISGAWDPRCKVVIVVVQTNPDGLAGSQYSQILVPMDAQGLEVLEPMLMFRYDDAPYGHAHLRFTNVRVPKDNVLLGAGRNSEISQSVLGAGRIHYCARSIGAAEKALKLMCQRGLSRRAFGKPLVLLGKNIEWVAQARIDIEAMRLMLLKAAKAMDLMEPADANLWLCAVKAMIPERVCTIIDRGIQLHGATGLSQRTPLADMYAQERGLRFAYLPDEVNHMIIGQAEIARYGPGVDDDQRGQDADAVRS